MNQTHFTSTANGHLVVAKHPSAKGWVAAIAWNDPAIYPTRRRGIETKLYPVPIETSAEAARCAAKQWATDMALDFRSGCLLLVDAAAVPGDKTAYEVGDTFVVNGAPVPTAWSDPKKMRRDAALQALADAGAGEDLILCPDGSLAAAPYEAVRKHMCPGPCSPECALYRIVQLQSGRHAKLCDEEAVAQFPDLALDAIGARYLDKEANR